MGVTGDTTRPASRPVDVEIATLAGRQHGVVSLAQLADAGLSPRAARHRVHTGRLHRVHPGVFAVGHPVLGADGRRLAAVLACGSGAVLSHRSAAAAWGLRPTSRVLHEVTVPRTAGTGPAGVEAHRARRMSPDDVTVLRAIPITSVARTLVDLAGVLAAHALERAVHEAGILRLFDVRALEAAIARAPNRRGVGTLRAVLAEPDPGPTHAGLEERFLALCRRAGVPPPRCNVTVPLGNRLLEVDAVWSRERVVVELDGRRVHHTAKAFEADRRRDASLVAHGYVVLRLTWNRVVRDPAEIVRDLRAVLAVRRPSYSPSESWSAGVAGGRSSSKAAIRTPRSRTGRGGS
jgi:Transcriptional regulator, AbiEi antitoxin/Protein of unknown function (DUF559)